MESDAQRQAQSVKTLAILEAKDGVIEQLEHQLDSVQAKVSELKCKLHAAEDRVLAAEHERHQARQLAQQQKAGAKKTAAQALEAEKKAQAASSEAQRLRQACQDLELEASRLARDARRSHAPRADGGDEARLRAALAQQRAQLAEAELQARARQSVQPKGADGLGRLMRQHQARLDALETELLSARSPSPGGSSRKLRPLEARCTEHKERLEALKEQRRRLELRRSAADESALEDLAQVEAAAERSRDASGKPAPGGERARELEMSLVEKELQTLKEELQVAEECLEAEPSCATLGGRARALRRVKAVQQARLQFFTNAKEEFSRKTKELPKPPDLAPDASILASLRSAKQVCEELQQELRRLGRDAEDKAAKGRDLKTEVQEMQRKWQEEEEEEEDIVVPSAPAWPQLPGGVLKDLVGNPLTTAAGQAAFEQVLLLLAQSHRQGLQAQHSSARWRRAARGAVAAANSPFAAPEIGLPLAPEELPRCALQEALDKELPGQRAKLEAEASALFAERGRQLREIQDLEARSCWEAALRAEKEEAEVAQASMEFLEGNWRDEVVEGAWAMAQRAGFTPSGGPVLRAAQVLRMMGLQLTTYELAWKLRLTQLQGDHLAVAAALGSSQAAPDARMQCRTELAEAGRLQRRAQQLGNEVQRCQTRLQDAKAREEALKLRRADFSAPGTSQDQALLMSMLDVMRQVMESCSQLVPGEGDGPFSTGIEAAIRQDVQEVSRFCQQLQKQLEAQQQQVAAAWSRVRERSLEQSARPDDSEVAHRLEFLLQTQKDLQLEYRDAAEELLALREETHQNEEQAEAASRTKSLTQEALHRALPAKADLMEAEEQRSVRQLEAAIQEAWQSHSAYEEAEHRKQAAASSASHWKQRREAAEEAAQAARLAEQQHTELALWRRAEQEEAAAEVQALQHEETEVSRQLRAEEQHLQEEAASATELQAAVARCEDQAAEAQRAAAHSASSANALRARCAALHEALPPGVDFAAKAPAPLSPAFSAARKLAVLRREAEAALAQEQQSRAEAEQLTAEAAEAQRAAGDLRKAKEAKALRLEAVEAKEQWQEVAQRNEHWEWRQNLKALQLQAQRGAEKAAQMAEESKQEATAAHELRKEVTDLESRTLRMRAELVHARAPVLPEQPRREEALLKELSVLRGQSDAMLEEMDRLRRAVDESEEASQQAENSQRADNSQRASSGRGRQRLFQQLNRSREQREALRRELQSSEREEQRLRQQLKEVEQQLQVSRDDADRKRSHLAQLQRSLEASSTEQTERLTWSERRSEAQEALQKARQQCARKDATLKELRAEAQEQRRLREQRRRAELQEQQRSEAEAARLKCLRAELRRKERLLQGTLTQTEVLESQLANLG